MNVKTKIPINLYLENVLVDVKDASDFFFPPVFMLSVVPSVFQQAIDC